MTRVVIAEKPSVGRDIARVLRATRRHEGYLEGNGTIVTWAFGHLLHFAEPNDYGGSWDGRWSFSQLPMVPPEWKLKTHEKTVAQFRIVKKLMNDPRTTEIICATDAGREGEHIFRLIYQHSRCRKPFRRLWISSLTDEAIQQGFRNLQPGEAFDDLARAARTRAQADWLIGMNLTRAYTVHHGALYTIGRVQTPTLGMIVKREEVIANFKKAFFYELVAHLVEGFDARYTRDGKTRLDSKLEAERLYHQLKDHKTGAVLEVRKKIRKLRPPPLYDLITLQKEANKRFGFSAAETLELAQTLYERYKLITYPRTESRHISEDMVPRLPGILEKLDHPQAPVALQRLRDGHKLGKAYVDRTRLSDHHGILPTSRKAPSGLSPRLRRIYDLVVARFTAIFLPDHLVEETRVSIDIGGALFTATGTLVLEEGWKVVETGKPEKRQVIPALEKGARVHIKNMELQEKETSPPKRYTDATLLAAMKNAGRELEDDALAEAMKESGLGTPATRAEIIEKLIRIRLVERKKKALFPTEKGIALIGVVAEPLKSAETTGAWEQKLKDIEHGSFSSDQFYRSIVDFVETLIPQVRRAPALGLPDDRGNRGKRGKKGGGGTGSQRGKRSEPKTVAAEAEVSPTRIASCPACGEGTIIEGHRAFGCTRYRLGCRFLVGKEVSGKKLSLKQVRDLLVKGRTAKLKGFRSKDGKIFTARLLLDAEHRLGFEFFPEEAKAGKGAVEEPGRCPQCGLGRIIEGKRGFGCNRYREGCNFVIWKEISGKKLTPTQVRDLVQKGKTRVLKGFIDASGRKFSARLSLDSSGKTHLEEGAKAQRTKGTEAQRHRGTKGGTHDC